MKLRIVFLLIGSIFSYYSCTESNSEEIKPEFIFAKTIGVNDMDKTINIGDSIKLNIKYRIEDQDYSFNKLICTDLGSYSYYAEQFLIKVELIKFMNRELMK
ncbi:MAG: hypothetical protein RBT49_11030 [Bacteroidales bacterium]|jgi:hypothetical protein|nr:hypothetical protein [Bacteroidales bacterium]